MSDAIYIFGISFVATVLFVAVDKIEPNRRYLRVPKMAGRRPSILKLSLRKPNPCHGPERRLQGDMIRLRPDRVPMPAGVIFCPAAADI
jgi:hypothetical protein